MIQYSIYTVYNGGRPYYGVEYTSLSECREALESIIKYHEKHHHLYYIDNDFFNNKFQYLDKCYYYSIHCREVSEWDNIDNRDKNKDIQNNRIRNNIIYFA